MILQLNIGIICKSAELMRQIGSNHEMSQAQQFIVGHTNQLLMNIFSL